MAAYKIQGGLDVNGQRIINVASPTGATDAANKSYVDAARAGIDWQDSVRAATTAAITLSGTQTVDGVALVAGDPVLVKNQTTASTNGTYIVAAGAWTRRDTTITAGFQVTVTEGTNKGTGTAVTNPLAWTVSNPDPIVVGTTSLTFVAASTGGTTYVAGNGISVTGSTIAVVAGTGIIADGTSTRIDQALVATHYAGNIPTTGVVTHNLGSTDVDITVRVIATGAEEKVPNSTTDANTITCAFDTAPTVGQYRAIVRR